MCVLKFAEEFTRLVNRYTRSSSPTKNSSNGIALLTDQQIVFAIHHVLQALAIKGFNDKHNPTEISNNASAVIKPEVSAAMIKSEVDVKDTCRSQDTQSVVTDDQKIFDIPVKTIKKERENSFNTMQNEKLISRSNPMICVTRSDTFIRKENTEDLDNVFNDFTNIETNDSLNNLIQGSLNELRKSATDIVSKLNYLEKLLPQSTNLSTKVTPKAVRQTCLINSPSSPHRISSATKTKMSTNIRRSSTAFPKTPTSSKLFITENGNLERRKSTGAIGLNAATIGKSSDSTKDHSISNLSASSYKTSPGSSFEFRPKFTKNPKYAHVRSTIPKPISQKRKKQ